MTVLPCEQLPLWAMLNSANSRTHLLQTLFRSFRWLILAAKSRGEKTMREKLAGEFVEAAENRGGAVKKKDDTHRMAEANKAFAHYRW